MNEVYPLAAENDLRIEAKATIDPHTLPEGTYYATAEIRLDYPKTVKEIPAGTIVLRRP